MRFTNPAHSVIQPESLPSRLWRFKIAQNKNFFKSTLLYFLSYEKCTNVLKVDFEK